MLQIADLQKKFQAEGPGRFPPNIGFEYPYEFVKAMYFDSKARDNNLDAVPGGYMAQDPTLDADLKLFGSLFGWAEHQVKNPKFKLAK